MKLLIVDDNAELGENLAEIFEDEGVEARAFPCAADARAWAASHAFDVALVDMCMPEEDGASLVGALSERHPNARYVIMTAYASADREAAARDAGARILRKPFDLTQAVEFVLCA